MQNEETYRTVKIKVIGVGGAGCNAVNHMIDYGIEGVKFISANTDAQALLNSISNEKINLGKKKLKGLGAGGIPDIGSKAALESEAEIRNLLEDIDMLFVISGMGGGTGTGAAPIICKIAKEMKILVIAVVTRPFNFEGRLRVTNANKGIENLKKNVDSMIIISNDKLLEIYGNNPLYDSFNNADETLRQAVQSITDLVVLPAKINLDFADIRTVFLDKKNALFGIGIGIGKRKAIDATREAVLLEASIKGIKNAIVNFTGGTTTTLFDINDSIDYIKKEAGNEINVIFGLKINKEMGDKMIVAIIGTEFNEEEVRYANPDYIKKIRNRGREEEINSSKTNSEKDYSSIKETNIENNKAKKNTNESDDDDLPSFMKW